MGAFASKGSEPGGTWPRQAVRGRPSPLSLFWRKIGGFNEAEVLGCKMAATVHSYGGFGLGAAWLLL